MSANTLSSTKPMKVLLVDGRANANDITQLLLNDVKDSPISDLLWYTGFTGNFEGHPVTVLYQERPTTALNCAEVVATVRERLHAESLISIYPMRGDVIGLGMGHAVVAETAHLHASTLSRSLLYSTLKLPNHCISAIPDRRLLQTLTETLDQEQATYHIEPVATVMSEQTRLRSNDLQRWHSHRTFAFDSASYTLYVQSCLNALKAVSVGIITADEHEAGELPAIEYHAHLVRVARAALKALCYNDG